MEIPITAASRTSVTRVRAAGGVSLSNPSQAMTRRLDRGREAPILALLSPAKKLDFERPLPDVAATDPELLDHTAVLLERARQLDEDALASLMHLSVDLATLTRERFRSFDLDPAGGRPAILAFTGEVYLGLNAIGLLPEDLLWAGDHLRILSGLYGLLRPLDRMHPYRLEMSTKLANPRGRDLYAFWRAELAPRIDAAVAGHADPTVVNLASDEYFSAVDRTRLAATVVTPVFQDLKDGTARSLFLYVKHARGALARWMVENRIERATDLRDAEIDGYRYDAHASEPDRWVFRRPCPPPIRQRRAASRTIGPRIG